MDVEHAFKAPVTNALSQVFQPAMCADCGKRIVTVPHPPGEIDNRVCGPPEINFEPKRITA